MTGKSYNALLPFHEDPKVRALHRKLHPTVTGMKALPHAAKMAAKKVNRRRGVA